MSDLIEKLRPVEQKDSMPPICPDFDGCCFEVNDPVLCAAGGVRFIYGQFYYLEPIVGICPLAKSK